MKPLHPGVKLTYDDFVLFPDDGKRHELIDGEHYVTPSPNTPHQQISGDLSLACFGRTSKHTLSDGSFMRPTDVVFSNFDVVEPDLLYSIEPESRGSSNATTRAGRTQHRRGNRLPGHPQARRDNQATPV